VGVFVLAALLSACGGSIPRVPAPAELGGLPQITVALAPEIESDRARVFQEQDGAARLRNAVLDEMIAHRRLTAPDEMHLLVTRFRLRSTAAGLWVGAMAGADMLDVNVTLVRGETTRSFSTGRRQHRRGSHQTVCDGPIQRTRQRSRRANRQGAVTVTGLRRRA